MMTLKTRRMHAHKGTSHKGASKTCGCAYFHVSAQNRETIPPPRKPPTPPSIQINTPTVPGVTT